MKYGADIADFDLEDSVPVQCKDTARCEFQRHLADKGSTTVAVRINELASIEGLRDMLSILEGESLPDIVILPKVAIPGDIMLASQLLSKRSNSVRIYVIVETVQALCDLRNLSVVPALLGGLMFGAADFAANRGVPLRKMNLFSEKREIAIAAARLGISAIDSPCFDIEEEGTLAEELDEALALGYCGKIAIHPNQVPRINAAFSPSGDSIEKAMALIAGASNQMEEPIVKIDGRMVGPPFVIQAMQEISRAGQRGLIPERYASQVESLGLNSQKVIDEQ